MSSLFSPSTPAAPPPPPPVDYVNTKDEVSGTQSNYVTNPDGTKTLVTSRLPLTPEQQAYEDKLQSIASDNLDYINKLSTNYNVADIPGLDQYLKDYQTTQVQGLDKSTADQANADENTLARFGQADSTAGVKDRAARGADYQNNRQAIRNNASTVEQQARQQAIGNSTNLYGLATGQQNTILSQLANSLGQQQNFQLADANAQTNRNNIIYQGALNQNALKASSGASTLGNLASLAALGTFAAGPSGFNVLSKIKL